MPAPIFNNKAGKKNFRSGDLSLRHIQNDMAAKKKTFRIGIITFNADAG
jgi:hypothetical protein